MNQSGRWGQFLLALERLTLGRQTNGEAVLVEVGVREFQRRVPEDAAMLACLSRPILCELAARGFDLLERSHQIQCVSSSLECHELLEAAGRALAERQRRQLRRRQLSVRRSSAAALRTILQLRLRSPRAIALSRETGSRSPMVLVDDGQPPPWIIGAVGHDGEPLAAFEIRDLDLEKGLLRLAALPVDPEKRAELELRPCEPGIPRPRRQLTGTDLVFSGIRAEVSYAVRVWTGRRTVGTGFVSIVAARNCRPTSAAE